MADDPKTAILTKVKEILDATPWPGADAGAEKPKEPETPAPTEAATMAERSRKKFDSILRWVLGLFSGIGILVFGTLPFVDLKDVDPATAGAGLALAGLGLVIVIAAATSALEPQDASLGELDLTLGRLKKVRRSRWWHRVWGYFRPRWFAARELKVILTSKDAATHLGPGVTSVAGLIEKIAVLEEEASSGKFVIHSPADGSASAVYTLRAFERPTGGGSSLAGTDETIDVLVLEAEQTRIKSELKELSGALTDLRKELVEITKDDKAEDALSLKKAISLLNERYAAFAALLADPNDIALIGQSVRKEAQLNLYRRHRALVLDESLVSQLRGTFRLMRNWLLVGGLATLVGGLVYAFALANPVVTSYHTPVVLTVSPGSQPWKELAHCLADKTAAISSVPALLIEPKQVNTDEEVDDEPFVALILAAGCEGLTLRFEDGDGSYEAPGGKAEAGGEADDDDDGVEVLVTLLVNTGVWRDTADCRPAPTAVDLRGLQAELISWTGDPDDSRDGPFTIRITDPRCSDGPRVVSVPEDDGRYKKTG